MPISIVIRFSGREATDFSDFLVGHAQPPIAFEIATDPTEATVLWRITPVGEQSGSIATPEGTSKAFSFAPTFGPFDRPTAGSRQPNAPISYRVTVLAEHPLEGTANVEVVITQNLRAVLRQEYVDYRLQVPDLGIVDTAVATANFTVEEFSHLNNYAPLVVNGGMQDIAQRTRDTYGRPIVLTSTYRNPQRNRAVGGAQRSVHQSGGAVDMTPTKSDAADLKHIVSLYRAALGVDPGLVLLELNARQLLPGNWAPPAANHSFAFDTASITVDDTDNDGLPDTVSAINNPPAGGIPIGSVVQYAGGGRNNVNPPFVFRSQDNSSLLQVGDKLLLQYPGQDRCTLRDYFDNASHVHADNRKLVQTTRLRQRIENQVADTGSLSINEDIVGIDTVPALMRATFGRQDFVIQNPQISGSDTSVHVTGNANFFSTTPIPVDVELTELESDDAELTIRSHNGLQMVDIDDALFSGAFVSPTRLELLQLQSLSLMPLSGKVNVVARSSQDIDVGGGFLVLKRPTLRIVAGQLLSPGAVEISANVKATVEFADVNFILAGDFRPDAAELANIEIKPAAGGFPSFTKLLSHFVPNLPDFPASLKVQRLELSKFLSTNSFTLTALIDGKWEFELGAAVREIRELSVEVEASPEDVTARIEGSITLFGNDIRVNSVLGDAIVVSGNLPNFEIDLNDSLRDLTGTALPLPNGISSISVPGQATFQIAFANAEAELAIQSPLSNGAELVAVVKKVGGAWESVVAVVLPDDWQFSDLSSVLRPFDVLKYDAPILAYSTFSDEQFTLNGRDGTTLSLQLKTGFALSSELKLSGVGLDFLAKLVGRDKLPLQLAIGNDISDAKIEANIEQELAIIPGVITFRGFALSLQPAPFTVEFVCIADVNIFGEELPRFAVETEIVENETRLLFQTLAPWKDPFGLSGLTINQVVLQVETAPVTKFGVLGDISIKDKRIRMAAQFTNNAPSMIAGELIGTLSLGDTIEELVGLRLPSNLLDISISDFKLRIVADPTGVTIGDETFAPGLALQGTLGFLGMSLFVKVVVDPDSGVFAHGSLSDRVNIGNVLLISDAEGNGPPSFTLNSSRAPFLEITAAVSLLGLRESIEATVDASGFEFTISRNLLIAKYSLTCKAKPPIDFTGSGTFSFGIDESIGPIQLAPGTPSLGRISLKAGFVGDLRISVTNNGFEGKAKGGFEFHGTTFKVPEISLSVVPQDIEEFPRRIVKEIIDKAEDIFSELFEDADKWLLAIRDKILIEVENVAAALKKHFQKDTKFIANAIQNTLGQGAEAAAKGLRSIGESAENIADALKDVGQVGADLANRVGDALSKAGFPDAAVKDALDKAFGGDAPEWPPHVKVPHIKHIKIPHVKHVKVPHVKHVKVPHVKHAKVPHVKHAKVPHVKHVKVPHVKHVKLPHAKHVKFF